MGSMLTIQLNDDAVQLLGLLLDGTLPLIPSGGLVPGLEDIIARGIVRRGQVLVWADSVGAAERASTIFHDLTSWECANSSLHLEDSVPVHIETVDDAPVISEAGQKTLLINGLAFGFRFAQLVQSIDEPSPVRCIIAANETNATFRFTRSGPASAGTFRTSTATSSTSSS